MAAVNSCEPLELQDPLTASPPQPSSSGSDTIIPLPADLTFSDDDAGSDKDSFIKDTPQEVIFNDLERSGSPAISPPLVSNILPTNLHEAADAPPHSTSTVNDGGRDAEAGPSSFHLAPPEDDVRVTRSRKSITSGQSETSSVLSSIEALPTQLPTSPVKPARVLRSNAAAAESSAQAAKRARKEAAAAARAKKAKALPKTIASTRARRSVKTVPKPVAKPAQKPKPKPKSPAPASAVVPKKKKEAAVVGSAKSRGKKRSESEDDRDSLVDVEKLEDEEEDETRGRGKRRKLAEPKVKEKPQANKPKIKFKKGSDNDHREQAKGKTRQIQLTNCRRPRYSVFGKCAHCSTNKPGEGCRFEGFKTFPINPETGDITGDGSFESIFDIGSVPVGLPADFTAPFEEEHIHMIERAVAPVLLPLISRELRHVVKNQAMTRAIDPAEHRSICDFCSSTIFAGYFFCRQCGRDFCLACERFFSESEETQTVSPWPLEDSSRPRLAKCVNSVLEKRDTGKSDDHHYRTKARPQRWHYRKDLQPISHFQDESLRAHWLTLAEFTVRGVHDKAEWPTLFGVSGQEAEKLVEEVEKFQAEQGISGDSTTKSHLSDEEVQKFYTKFTHSSIPLPLDPANLRSQSLAFMRIDESALDNPTFDQLWSRGEPIVVDGVGDKLHLKWTPETMISMSGDVECEVMDCEKEGSWIVPVKEFFEAFKDHSEHPDDIWKLKDWPSTSDFQGTYPRLYDDFARALPVPDYTNLKGVMNLYAHFPPGPSKPDLGPKMYNAFAGKETIGGHGSTRLHMDVADAINVMLYASDRPSTSNSESGSGSDNAEAGPSRDAQPLDNSAEDRPSARSSPSLSPPPRAPPVPLTGSAVWDIFRAEDADKIRDFLMDRFPAKKYDYTDPIHSQEFYLDAGSRQELWKAKGVASFRIYQYPAVFIPAGCAHQVCNLADCIKIAQDFVSPHNIPRFQRLSQDFRKENFVRAWKDDVLQLYNILWFAWLSSRETRDRRQKGLDNPARFDTLADISSARGSTSGRNISALSRTMTSSVRDDPAHPHPSSLNTTTPSSAKPKSAEDPARMLVERLLQSSLTSPDPPAPADIKPPVRPGPNRPAASASGSGSASKTGKNGSAGREGKESEAASMTLREIQALVQSGLKMNAREVFESGKMPLEFVEDLVLSGLDQGRDEEEAEMEM